MEQQIVIIGSEVDAEQDKKSDDDFTPAEIMPVKDKWVGFTALYHFRSGSGNERHFCIHPRIVGQIPPRVYLGLTMMQNWAPSFRPI